MDTLLDHTLGFLNEHGLAGRCGVAAVSGGPDSVVLAHILGRLLEAGKIKGLTLAHLDHGLRGQESASDAVFVANLPGHWGWPNLSVRVHSVDTAGEARRTGQNLESTARKLRYEWLGRMARDCGGAWVATGHTADDQAETVLHRFLRGAGWQGWRGMPSTRPLTGGGTLVRPFLTSRRKTLQVYLAAHKLPFRIDSTNADPRFTRNRLRLELLPFLEQSFNPRIVENLLEAARLSEETHAYLEESAQAVLLQAELPRAGTVLVLDRDRLARERPLMQRQVFRLLWRREDWPEGDMTAADWDRLTDLTAGRTAAWNFPGGINARQTPRVLQVGPGL